MRLLGLLFLLLLHTVAAPAQSRPPLVLADSVAAAPLDSAAALHHMFVVKRNNRTVLMVGTVLVGSISLILSNSQLAGQRSTTGLTLLAITAEALYYRQYSPEKEQLALQALAQHKLSTALKRNLKPLYFKASALSTAQASPLPAPAPRPVAAAPASVDTAAALHRLFVQRRDRGHVGLRIGGGVLAVSGIALAIGINQGGYNGLGAAAVGVVGGVFSVPILIRSAVLTIAHSKGREQRVLEAWQQHRLPKRWARRALVPKYLQPQP
ncbi:MAG: hypothetical protein ACRYG7_14825 [Janthinobacterium lividum]